MKETSRRALLIGLGSSAVAVAGCNSSPEGSTPTSTQTRTPTDTPEPTPTPTPEPRAPSVESVSLVSRWEEFGDTREHEINAVGKGAPAIIAYRYNAGVHDGTVDTTEQAKVFSNRTDQRVGLEQDSGEQLVDSSGYQTWEHALRFDTSDWDLGGYTVELLVRDNIINKTSGTVESQFIVNDPLSGQAVSLVGVEGPDAIRVGERYEFTLTLENNSTSDGSVVSSMSARYSDTDWTTFDLEVTTTLGEGETNTWEGYHPGFNYEGTVHFRLNSIDETWSVDVIN